MPKLYLCRYSQSGCVSEVWTVCLPVSTVIKSPPFPLLFLFFFFVCFIDEGDGPMARFHVELEDGSSTTERLVAYFTKVQ